MRLSSFLASAAETANDAESHSNEHQGPNHIAWDSRQNTEPSQQHNHSGDHEGNAKNVEQNFSAKVGVRRTSHADCLLENPISDVRLMYSDFGAR